MASKSNVSEIVIALAVDLEPWQIKVACESLTHSYLLVEVRAKTIQREEVGDPPKQTSCFSIYRIIIAQQMYDLQR